jgi:DNA-binding SARP family transcriptional activator
MGSAPRRTRGCRLFVAAAGYGKTSALEAAYARGPMSYRSAADLAARLADDRGGAGLTVAGDGVQAVQVAIDDLCHVPVAAQRQVARLLSRVPDEVTISLAARRPLADSVLAALPGPVVEHTAADLALPLDGVARVLRDDHGVVDAEAAYLVHDLTVGWPALVAFAGDAVARGASTRSELIDALTEPGSPAAAWMWDEALAGLPAPVARLLDGCTYLDPISRELCEELAAAGHLAYDEDWLAWLRTVGLVTAIASAARPDDAGFRVVPVVAGLLARRGRAGGLRSGGAGERAGGGRLATAARWYAANGHALAAARALRATSDRPALLALIADRDAEILAAGGAADLVDAIRSVPPAERSARLNLALGEALRMAGDGVGAWRLLEPLLVAAEPAGRWPAGLLWRAAMVHYMRSDYRAALDLCRRPVAAAADDVDLAQLAACRSTAQEMLGATEEAAATAAEALAVARRSGCDRALAVAHIAMAMASFGARRDEHLAEALAAAERVGDIVTMTRVLVNQADLLLLQARYGQALDLAARAVRVAERGCPPGLLAVALVNAGEALLRLGRFDEAALHFERTVAISRRGGLNRAAMGLAGLGELHRLRGRVEQSRAAFEEVIELTRAAADRRVLTNGLVGLARVLLAAGDLDGAAAAADEAAGAATPLTAPRALVAQGWVALARGDVATARARSADAVRAARDSRGVDALAEALELTASVTTDRGESRSALGEAEAIWRQSGALVAADQMLVRLGRLPGAEGAQRSAAKLAAERLRALGVATADGLSLLGPDGAAVGVRILGPFEVVVSGVPVPLTAWRSRQARSLLKILVARRGSPVARSELSELLWPDDDADRTGHRLSVLLSIIRTVLDPARRWPTDHYVRADIVGISLDIQHVSVDVEELIRDAAHAEQLRRAGDVDGARPVLADVDAMYRGDAFADEPYEDWAHRLREEARAVWLRALRSLAELARAAGEVDLAVTSFVRLLAADPYDEMAHRSLVRVLAVAGRHGEAHRAFTRWAEAMRSIDAPPPAPRVLEVAGPRR